MASTYSSLKIQLMATGENSTTWGGITNTNLGTALEEAVKGSADVTFASADLTLTLVDSNTTQAARNLRLNLIGSTGGSPRNLVVPAITGGKNYIVNNTCADAVTVKNATGTGISVPAGKTMYLYNDGTNVVEAVTYMTSFSTSALAYTTTFTGGTGIVNLGSGQFYKDASGNVGIGTASPVTYGKLAVIGNIGANNYYISDQSTTAVGAFGFGSVNGPTIEMYGSSVGNAVLFKISNSEKMRIEATGNVGIGTSTPAARLSIVNAASVQFQVSTGTVDYRVQAIDASSIVYVGTTSNHTFGFTTNNSERMRIDASGNVGIGTSVNYGGRLTVIPAAAITTPAAANQIQIGEASANTLYRMQLGYFNNGGAYAGSIQSYNNGAAGDLVIQGAGGNVGIGTSSPGDKLTVYGASTPTIRIQDATSYLQIYTTGGTSVINNAGAGAIVLANAGSEKVRIDASGNVGIGNTAPDVKLVVTGSTTLTSQANVAARVGANTTSDLLLGSTNGNAPFVASQGAYPLALWTNALERMRIDASGNVGIGTASPVTYGKLAVIGNVGASNYYLSDQSTSTAGAFGFGSANGPAIEMYGSASVGAGAMLLKTANNERMRIAGNGNIGIGTTDTTNKVTVDGGSIQNLGLGNVGGFEMVSGPASTWYSSGLRADTTNMYLIMSSAQTTKVAAQSAGFNALRPLSINLSTGQVALDQTGAGVSVGGLFTIGGDAAFAAAVAPTSTLSVGYRGVPQNAKTANYTLALTDSGDHIYLSGTTASQSITVPANSSVAFQIGTAISLVNDTTQTWTVPITTDTMQLAGGTTTGTRTRAVGAVATLLKVTATKWFISGAGVS